MASAQAMCHLSPLLHPQHTSPIDTSTLCQSFMRCHGALHGTPALGMTSRSKLNPFAIFEVAIFPRPCGYEKQGSPHSHSLKCPSGFLARASWGIQISGRTRVVRGKGAGLLGSLQGGEWRIMNRTWEATAPHNPDERGR